MKSNKVLEIAEKKIRVSYGRRLCACITASETMALHNVGYKFDEDDLLSAIRDMKEGYSSPNWRYFTAPKDREIVYKDQHKR